jgi:hypothetical protein
MKGPAVFRAPLPRVAWDVLRDRRLLGQED